MKHDRELHAELSKLMFRLLSEYFSEAAGTHITTAMVSSLQTFGEYASKKLHYDSETDTVTWQAPKKGHFRGKEQYYTGLDFIVLHSTSWTFSRSGNSKHYPGRANVNPAERATPGTQVWSIFIRKQRDMEIPAGSIITGS
jgi:hypothetical protein